MQERETGKAENGCSARGPFHVALATIQMAAWRRQSQMAGLRDAASLTEQEPRLCAHGLK